MHLRSRSALLATALFTLHSNALPRPAPAAPSYSVVAVDGGQNSAPAPTTIIHTVTDSNTSPQQTTTVSITTQETASPATTTILSTAQAPAATAAPDTVTVEGPPGPEATQYPPTVVAGGYTTTAILSYTTTLTDATHTTVYESGVTTTVLSLVTPSTSYFDDGMWHTSYGVPVWPTKNAAAAVKQYSNQTVTTAAGEAGPRATGGVARSERMRPVS